MDMVDWMDMVDFGDLADSTAACQFMNQEMKLQAL
jgi:hypothetical protein